MNSFSSSRAYFFTIFINHWFSRADSPKFQIVIVDLMDFNCTDATNVIVQYSFPQFQINYCQLSKTHIIYHRISQIRISKENQYRNSKFARFKFHALFDCKLKNRCEIWPQKRGRKALKSAGNLNLANFLANYTLEE